MSKGESFLREIPQNLQVWMHRRKGRRVLEVSNGAAVAMDADGSERR